MHLGACFRMRDLVITAAAFATMAVLVAVGHESWVGGTSAILVPLYLAAYRRSSRT